MSIAERPKGDLQRLLNPGIWVGNSDPFQFCRENRPVSSLVRQGWQRKPFNWERIVKIAPGSFHFDSERRISFGQIWGAELLKKDMFLDVGCGPGAGTCLQGRFIYGIDPNVHGPVLPERSVLAVAEDLPFEDVIFDGIISDKVVGYYPDCLDYWGAVGEMLRVLKVDRLMFIRTGMHMTGELYKETEERAKALDHLVYFPLVSGFYIITKKNKRWKI